MAAVAVEADIPWAVMGAVPTKAETPEVMAQLHPQRVREVMDTVQSR